jgi:hypothetical protein
VAGSTLSRKRMHSQQIRKDELAKVGFEAAKFTAATGEK